jgi:hypothetical protein
VFVKVVFTRRPALLYPSAVGTERPASGGVPGASASRAGRAKSA